MKWQLRVPHTGDLYAPLDANAITDLPQAIEDREERAIARELLIAARTHGGRHLGELTIGIENLDKSRRRQLLDMMRRRAGLPTTGRSRPSAAASGAGRLPWAVAAEESPWVLCAHPDCCATPVDARTGLIATPNVRRWWCPTHRHMAQPGDMLPRPTQLRISESGAIVENDPTEAARDAAGAEHRRHEERLAARRYQAEVMDEEQRAQEEALRARLPEGFPGCATTRLRGTRLSMPARRCCSMSRFAMQRQL